MLSTINPLPYCSGSSVVFRGWLTQTMAALTLEGMGLAWVPMSNSPPCSTTRLTTSMFVLTPVLNVKTPPDSTSTVFSATVEFSS